MKEDVRLVNGVYEFLDENGRQISAGGEIIATTDEEIAAIRDALYEETSFGELYTFSIHNFKILGQVSAKLNRFNPLPDAFTKARIFEAYDVLNSAGGQSEFGNLERVPEEVEAPTTPVARDEQGRFQNQLLSEYHAMLDDPNLPASAITQRMRIDRPFREAVEASRIPKPAHRTGDETSLEELKIFAARYRRAKSVKPISGIITLAEYNGTPIEYTVEEVNALLERASAANVI